MNIIFITLGRVKTIETRGIYTDLMRMFRDEGHNVYIVTPFERRLKLKTSLEEVDGIHLLGVKTLNIKKTNIIEKGIGTILLESQIRSAIKKYLSNVSFDLILYSTPPITFTNVVKYLKKTNPKAITYLLLKDIFPQNAVDLQLFSKGSIFYKYFRYKERNLYLNSDFIGCMSPANVKFLLKYNSYLDKSKVEVAPNSISIVENNKQINRSEIRKKYGLPIDKPVFIYGGNLGKPQGVDFLISCMDANKNRTDCHFLIVGGGTEYKKIDLWYKSVNPKSVSLFSSLPKNDYDNLASSCDVGLIFLDHRFTIPNFPSRLLPYLENKMPILAATDINSDEGTIAQDNGFGFWCESVKPKDFTECVNKYVNDLSCIKVMGEKGYQFLIDNYQTQHTYKKIVSHIKK